MMLNRRRVLEIVESGGQGDPLPRFFDAFMVVLIITNVIAVALETVPDLAAAHGLWFNLFDAVSVIIFTLEYLARVWSCVDIMDKKYRHPVWGRLRWMMTPMAIIDLLAFLPFYLSMFIGVDLRFLRIFRLLRLLKLTRYSRALDTLFSVLHNESKTLFAAFTIMMVLLVSLSSIVYFIERDIVGTQFTSIPAAMWWGMATLTTVGYGDMVPQSDLGRLFGAMVTLLGLGMFALPAAILASGFTREAKKHDFTVSWNLVAHVPLFAQLNAADISDIVELLKPQIASPGEVIFYCGAEGDAVYFIVFGEVAVALPAGEKSICTGEFFGELALLHKQPRVATVKAVQTCQLLVLRGIDFHDLLDRHEHLRAEIKKVAAVRMSEVAEFQQSGENVAGEGI